MADLDARTGPTTGDLTMSDPDPLGTHTPDLGATTTLKSGALFMVTQTSGDVPAQSARTGPHGLGLYFHDTRFLDEKRMHVNGRPMTLLFESADLGDRCTRELTNPELPVQGGGTIQKETIGLHVDTTLGAEVREVLTFRNFSREHLEVTLTLAYGSGFDDIFTVRGMAPGARGRLLEPKAEGGSHVDLRFEPLIDGRQVEYLGELGDGEKNELLGSARALLFPVDWPEPFGLAMTEAMACGTPVLALRRGSLPEVVEDGVTGFVRDIEEELADVADQVTRLSRRACRERVERLFSVEAMTDGYEAVYQSLTA